MKRSFASQMKHAAPSWGMDTLHWTRGTAPLQPLQQQSGTHQQHGPECWGRHSTHLTKPLPSSRTVTFICFQRVGDCCVQCLSFFVFSKGFIENELSHLGVHILVIKGAWNETCAQPSSLSSQVLNLILSDSFPFQSRSTSSFLCSALKSWHYW